MSAPGGYSFLVRCISHVMAVRALKTLKL